MVIFKVNSPQKDFLLAGAPGHEGIAHSSEIQIDDDHAALQMPLRYLFKSPCAMRHLQLENCITL